ncbi:MAG: transposase [Candidatus Omnitrophica bacterium]|nr:transposase [Candidatus Omnitrophota bacterium]
MFFSKRDYSCFLEIFQEAKIKHPCFIYSYCLMPNHFHLLVEPKEKDNISWLMKLLGGKYVRYFNNAYKRTGTLWEGRFKSSLIDKELYFLACLHYIEMNPVRKGIVNSPEFYPWSSYRVRAFGEKNSIIDLDLWYNALGNNETERQMKYRNFFQHFRPEIPYTLIRNMTKRNGIVGGNDFRESIEKLTHREIIFRLPGRPRIKIVKNKSDPVS